jgi:hypothetical protein
VWWQNEYPPLIPQFIGDDLAQVSTVTQDVALGVSLAGASLEIGGAVMGGPGGAEVGYAMQLVITNPIETALSLASTGITAFSDLLVGETYIRSPGDWAIGEATQTSVLGTLLGNLVHEGIIDSVIDGYVSSYNHGQAPAIPWIDWLK